MSDETKELEDKIEETADPDTTWGKFESQKDDPESVSYFLHGLLSQTNPALKNQLVDEYKVLLSAADTVSDLMNKIMSTPGGRSQFEKEVDKFTERRAMNESSKENPGGQEDA